MTRVKEVLPNCRRRLADMVARACLSSREVTSACFSCRVSNFSPGDKIFQVVASRSLTETSDRPRVEILDGSFLQPHILSPSFFLFLLEFLPLLPVSLSLQLPKIRYRNDPFRNTPFFINISQKLLFSAKKSSHYIISILSLLYYLFNN